MDRLRNRHSHPAICPASMSVQSVTRSKRKKIVTRFKFQELHERLVELSRFFSYPIKSNTVGDFATDSSERHQLLNCHRVVFTFQRFYPSISAVFQNTRRSLHNELRSVSEIRFSQLKNSLETGQYGIKTFSIFTVTEFNIHLLLCKFCKFFNAWKSLVAE